MKTKQMSDNFVTGSILAVVGGFLDAYTYLCRGGVFANAQTGNIVLFGVKLSEGNLSAAGHYAMPILAFVAGIVIAEIIKLHYKERQLVHWRQIVVVLELVSLLIVAGIPQGKWDFVANILVSFVCSLQVESFRKVNGYAYASTMCTGNLRSATEHLFNYFRTGEKGKLKASLHYYGIILFFIFGAAVGAVLTEQCSVQSVYVAAVGLGVVVLMMFQKRESAQQMPEEQ